MTMAPRCGVVGGSLRLLAWSHDKAMTRRTSRCCLIIQPRMAISQQSIAQCFTMACCACMVPPVLRMDGAPAQAMAHTAVLLAVSTRFHELQGTGELGPLALLGQHIGHTRSEQLGLWRPLRLVAHVMCRAPHCSSGHALLSATDLGMPLPMQTTCIAHGTYRCPHLTGVLPLLLTINPIPLVAPGGPSFLSRPLHRSTGAPGAPQYPLARAPQYPLARAPQCGCFVACHDN